MAIQLVARTQSVADMVTWRTSPAVHGWERQGGKAWETQGWTASAAPLQLADPRASSCPVVTKWPAAQSLPLLAVAATMHNLHRR